MGTPPWVEVLLATRCHHLFKTFCGWSKIQEPDDTITWKTPTGHTCTTTPASALLFANLTRTHARSNPPPF